jgi:hypothetical protein
MKASVCIEAIGAGIIDRAIGEWVAIEPLYLVAIASNAKRVKAIVAVTKE